MNTQVHNAVASFLRTTAYHQCLLLVHPDVRRLEAVADQLVSTYDWPCLSVGQELASVLLADLPTDRPHAARRWVETTLGQAGPDPLLVTETDLLFEPTLQLDALALLRRVSRVSRLVVTWPGSYADNVLAYAVPEHGHYRTWHDPDVFVVVLE